MRLKMKKKKKHKKKTRRKKNKKKHLSACVVIIIIFFFLSIISAVSDFTVPFIRKLYPQLFSGFNDQINESIYISVSYITFYFVIFI